MKEKHIFDVKPYYGVRNFKQNKQIYYGVYNRLFGKVNRIYLPFEDRHLTNVILSELESARFKIIVKTLVAIGWTQCENDKFLFYKADSPNQKTKMTKIIDKIPCKDYNKVRGTNYGDSYKDSDINYLSRMKTNIDLANYVNNGGKFSIAISRKKEDIISMSYNRLWNSCMNISNNSHLSNKVKEDIANGTLIAYLIKNDDKNILEPLARTLIKPYRVRHAKNSLLYVPGRTYACGVLGYWDDTAFIKTLRDYCVNNFNEKLINDFTAKDLSCGNMSYLFGGTYKQGIMGLSYKKFLNKKSQEKVFKMINKEISKDTSKFEFQQIVELLNPFKTKLSSRLGSITSVSKLDAQTVRVSKVVCRKAKSIDKVTNGKFLSNINLKVA